MLENMKITEEKLQTAASPPKEGDIYKTVSTFGKEFELRYGYYDEMDRGGEPDVIYPDFLKTPTYTARGEPFVTMMQDACRLYHGKSKRNEDTTCAECYHFERGEEWFGICKCPKNKRTNE